MDPYLTGWDFSPMLFAFWCNRSIKEEAHGNCPDPISSYKRRLHIEVAKNCNFIRIKYCPWVESNFSVKFRPKFFAT